MTRLKTHIYSLLAAGALSLGGLLSGCAEDMDFTPEGAVAEDAFSIEIRCSDVATRAFEAGEDALNENLIRSATVCLWPNGGDWLSSKEPMYMETFRDLNAVGSAQLRLPLTQEMINSLFNVDGSQTCKVFVAVNVEPGDARTVDELRALAISSEFDSAKKQAAFAMDGEGEARFLDLGSGGASASVEVARSASKITLHLDVAPQVKENTSEGESVWTPDYSGMSVSLYNGVRNSTLDPVPSAVEKNDYFNTPSSLSYSFVKNESADSDYPYTQDIPFYSYPNSWESEEQGAGSSRTHLTLRIPWTSDGGQSYRTCYYSVPVTELTRNEIVRNTSYHVRLKVGMLGSLVPNEPLPIKENLSYGTVAWGREEIDVDINEVRYLVVDQNDFEVNNEENIKIQFYSSHPTEVIDATMTFYRYNFSDMGSEFAVTVTNAQNEASKNKGAAVFTPHFDNAEKILSVSHPLKVYQPYDKNGNQVDLTNGDKKNAASSRPKAQTQAAVNAVLNKIAYFASTGYDEYSRVVFKVTVQHSDMKGTPNFKETVTITQYPAMYITAVQNHVAVNSSNGFEHTGGEGSTYINGNYAGVSISYSKPSGGVSNGWMTSIGLSTGYLNWNPNLYLITITSLPSGSPYHIGDPRSDKINNSLSDANVNTQQTTAWSGEKIGTVDVVGFANAKAIYPNTNTRTLKYYYPTREDGTSKNMIAPKFRVCSSYGGTGDILTRSLSRRRAAAYQELGYAAGRWRLPTYSEIEFLMQLSADLKIPRLFGRSDDAAWHYWCANGAAKVPGKATPGGNINPSLVSNHTNSTPERARFVYDEWYWGEETLKPLSNPGAGKPKYEFTWGDRPRQ